MASRKFLAHWGVQGAVRRLYQGVQINTKATKMAKNTKDTPIIDDQM
jgi:hypothetical protein